MRRIKRTDYGHTPESAKMDADDLAGAIKLREVVHHMRKAMDAGREAIALFSDCSDIEPTAKAVAAMAQGILDLGQRTAPASEGGAWPEVSS